MGRRSTCVAWHGIPRSAIHVADKQYLRVVRHALLPVVTLCQPHARLVGLHAWLSLLLCRLVLAGSLRMEIAKHYDIMFEVKRVWRQRTALSYCSF